MQFSVEQKTASEFTAIDSLCDVIRKKDSKALRKFVDNFRDKTLLAHLLKQRNSRHQTALALAVAGGNAECVEILLDNGADPCLRDEVRHEELTALHHAYWDVEGTYVLQTDIAFLLLKAIKFDIFAQDGTAIARDERINLLNAKDSDGNTLLSLAIGANLPFAALLPSYGRNENINKREKHSGDTALHLAAQSGDLHCIYAILSVRGVKTNIPNAQGHTALDLLKHYLPPKDFERVTSYSHQQESLLFIAVHYNWPDLIRTLREHVDVNAVAKEGNTALHQAIESDLIKCVLELLRADDIDLTIKNKKGFTAKQLLLEKYPVPKERKEEEEYTPQEIKGNRVKTAMTHTRVVEENYKNVYSPIGQGVEILGEVIRQGDSKTLQGIVDAIKTNDAKRLAALFNNEHNAITDKPDGYIEALLKKDNKNSKEDDDLEEFLKFIEDKDDDDDEDDDLEEFDHSGAEDENLKEFKQFGPLNKEKLKKLHNAGELEFHVTTNIAILRRNQKCAEDLLQNGDGVKTLSILLNAPNIDGQRPLHIAALAEDADCVRILLENKADTNLRNREGLTPLHLGYNNTELHTDIVSLLLPYANPALFGQDKTAIAHLKRKELLRAKDNHWDTLLHLAIKNNYGILVSLPIHGADINAINKKGDIPILKLPRLVDHKGNTALHYALREKSEETALSLLRYPFDASLKNKQGWSSIEIAISRGYRRVLDRLIELSYFEGANLEIQKTDFLVDIAVFCNQPSLIPILSKFVDINKPLPEDKSENDGDTPLHVAIKKGHYECILALLALEKIDFNIRNKSGETALELIDKMVNAPSDVLQKIDTLIKANPKYTAPPEIKATSSSVSSSSLNEEVIESKQEAVTVQEEKQNTEAPAPMSSNNLNKPIEAKQELVVTVTVAEEKQNIDAPAPVSSNNLNKPTEAKQELAVAVTVQEEKQNTEPSSSNNLLAPPVRTRTNSGASVESGSSDRSNSNISDPERVERLKTLSGKNQKYRNFSGVETTKKASARERLTNFFRLKPKPSNNDENLEPSNNDKSSAPKESGCCVIS